MTTLPAAFWWCLAGGVLGGGATLFAAWRWLTGAGALRRLRRVLADEGASSIVEFPFALLSLVLIIVLSCQLVFMASAYLVVDYAAYAAVRVAIVAVPEDRSKDDSDEGVNKIKKLDLSDGSKGTDVRDAAIFVCTAISSSGWNAAVAEINEVTAKFGVVLNLPGIDDLPALGGITAYVDRYLYSRYHTTVRMLAEGDSPKQFEEADLLRVEVTHDFELLVPIASRILGTKKDGIYVTHLYGRAAMLNEGFPGEEKEPEGAGSP